jgi:pimeloyl-ACP methyl ester carboxylesterase
MEIRPTLVLLHGMGTGPEAWRAQVDAFNPSRRVLAPAVRLTSEFSIASEAARLWRLTDSTPVDLCGLSLGALIALRAALDEPQRVRRLVLCAGFSSLSLPLRAIQAVLGAVAPSARAVFREGRRFDVTQALDRITMPTLVLCGERDWANRRLSRTLAESIATAASGHPGRCRERRRARGLNDALRSFSTGKELGRPTPPGGPTSG